MLFLFIKSAHRTVLVVATALATLGPMAVQASPWTLPAGVLVVGGRFDYESANEEWLDDGSAARPFSLRGEYQSVTYTLSARLGITDKFELELQIPLRQVSYSSDPVLLNSQPGDDVRSALDFYQDNVLDLSRTVRGLGDVRLTARHRLWRGPLSVGAAELQLKTPTGYAAPAGTFGSNPRSIAEFEANAGQFARPENVTDDVTLGDGQVDIRPALLLGWGFATGTFVRLDVGYALRLSGAGDQVFGSARVGQSLGQRILIYTGLDGEKAVEDGRRIGVSVSAIDPSLPATEYEGTNNLLLREVHLDRDRLTLPVGGILRITPAAELNLGVGIPLHGRNTSRITTWSLGFALRTDPIE